MAIEPKLGAGLRDYLPADMIPRQKMLDTIRQVFEEFGFVPLDTPGLELEEVLTGGNSDFKMQIFRARLRDEQENLALRFDLTVPLARIVAQYQDKITRPFKRYQMGKVWRGEKPQAGRFREFTQFDIDIVGCARVIADAEIIALMHQAMMRLGVNDFLIRVNNRKLLNGLPEYIGFRENILTAILRLIDKIEQLGWENVAGEMAEKLRFSEKQLTDLKRFLDFRGENQIETLRGVKELMSQSQIAQQGIVELEEISQHLKILGVPDDKWTIDLSVARGLGYYTGPVFETVLTKLPSIGSVFSGGRFDDLVSRFNPFSIPATGASLGVDRLFAALGKMGLIKGRRLTAQVLVLNFDRACEFECERAATSLRNAGISTELFFGKEETLKGQLSYAVKEEYPFVVIIGGNEKTRGTAQVKNMKSRTQVEMTMSGIVASVKTMIDQTDP